MLVGFVAEGPQNFVYFPRCPRASYLSVGEDPEWFEVFILTKSRILWGDNTQFLVNLNIIFVLEGIYNAFLYTKSSQIHTSSQNSTFCQDEDFKSLWIFSDTQIINIMVLGHTGENTRGPMSHPLQNLQALFLKEALRFIT